MAFWETILMLQIGTELRAGTEQIFSAEIREAGHSSKNPFYSDTLKTSLLAYFPKVH